MNDLRNTSAIATFIKNDFLHELDTLAYCIMQFTIPAL